MYSKFCAQPLLTSTKQVSTRKSKPNVSKGLKKLDGNDHRVKSNKFETKKQLRKEKFSHDLVELFFPRG